MERLHTKPPSSRLCVGGPTVAAHQLVTMSNLVSKVEMIAVKHMDQSQRVFGNVLVMFFCLD